MGPCTTHSGLFSVAAATAKVATRMHSPPASATPMPSSLCTATCHTPNWQYHHLNPPCAPAGAEWSLRPVWHPTMSLLSE